MDLVLTEIVFSWGFFIKPPYLSLGGQSIPYPPPTTLIGALAYPYMRYRNDYREIVFIRGKPHSPAVELLDKVKYAVLGFPSPLAIQVTDINKYYTYAYLRKEHRRNEKMWSSVVGVTKTYSPVKAIIAYLVNEKYTELVEKIARGITRIGSKESIVSVTRTSVVKKPVEKNVKLAKTMFPTPVHAVKQAIEGAVETVFWKIDPQAYSTVKELDKLLVKYYVPGVAGKIYGGYMKLVVDPTKAVVYETVYGHLVVPREVVT